MQQKLKSLDSFHSNPLSRESSKTKPEHKNGLMLTNLSLFVSPQTFLHAVPFSHPQFQYLQNHV